MSQWGLSLQQAASLTDRQLAGLMGAYLERKRVEAKIILSIVGEAMKPKQPDMSMGALAAMGIGMR